MRIDRAARLTPADHRRQRAAVARYEARLARERRAERLRRLAVVAALAGAFLLAFYTAGEPTPAEGSTYRATGWDGATVGHGLALGDCMALFELPHVAGCERE